MAGVDHDGEAPRCANGAGLFFTLLPRFQFSATRTVTILLSRAVSGRATTPHSPDSSVIVPDIG